MEAVIVILVLAVFWVLPSAICAHLAGGRGRSGVGWFFIGLGLSVTVCPVVPIVLVLALPDLAAEEARDARLRTENRRLREQLRKDRAVADRRHGDVDRRLGAHDTALMIDTDDDPDGGLDRPRLLGEPDAIRLWYYVANGEQQGPADEAAMLDLYGRSVIDESSYVWRDGMSNWAMLRDVAELKDALGA